MEEGFALNDIGTPELTKAGRIIFSDGHFTLSGLADHATGATIDINAGSIRSLNTYGKIRKIQTTSP